MQLCNCGKYPGFHSTSLHDKTKEAILDQIYDKLMDNKQYDLLNSYEVNKPEVDRNKSTITFDYLGYNVVMNISITKKGTK